MTRARWILSAASLSALWLIGALVCLPQLQRDLGTAARETLSQQTALRKRLGGLHLVFDGQVAHLSGRVRSREDRNSIETALRDLVRAPAPLAGRVGRHFNPVSGVRNEIEIVPCPPGWMLLAANGDHARLLGTAANDFEARDLARSVQENWNIRGGTTEGQPGTDPDQHDEADAVSATLRGLPVPHSGVRACLARIGQSWKDLELDKPDADLATEARTAGVSEDEWHKQVLPVLQDLRATLQQQNLAKARNELLALLPPGYLFIAARDKQVILRGEVVTAAMKEAILEDDLTAFAPCHLHDEIQVSLQRCPHGDIGPITTALLPEGKKTGAKSCFLSLSGGAWQAVEWQISASEQSWKNHLPEGIDAVPLQNDSARLSTWLEGDDSNAPPSSSLQKAAVIALALFGTKAIVSGRVAEEASRSQILASIRLAYGSQFIVVSDQFHVCGSCEPASNILHTLKSLPSPPAENGVGLFAIAKPGSPWTVIPVTRKLVEAGGIAQSGLLPVDISAALVENLAADTIEQLRQLLANSAFR